jgi:DNA-binding XRE family transcriptional regulator
MNNGLHFIHFDKKGNLFASVYIDLGEHIQLARLRRKLSAEQIAKPTGQGRKTIYNIEQGIPTVDIGSFL